MSDTYESFIHYVFMYILCIHICILYFCIAQKCLLFLNQNQFLFTFNIEKNIWVTCKSFLQRNYLQILIYFKEMSLFTKHFLISQKVKYLFLVNK